MRRGDLSGPKLLDHCVTCYNCQKKAQKETVQFVSETPGEKYQGNLEVRSEKARPSADGRIYYDYICYTGKWKMPFGNFCSVKCGLNWANHQIFKMRCRKYDKENNKIGNAIKSEDRDELAKLKDSLHNQGVKKYA